MMGVDASPLEARPDSSLGSQIYEANAAMAGQGVAILTRQFFAEDLAAGRLVQPFAPLYEDGAGYWLCYPERRRAVPKIRFFRDWIVGEFSP